MKIQIKMGTEETEAFKNFMGDLRPEAVSEDDFVRTIFYKGVEKFQEELFQQMQDYMEANKDDIDASALEMMGNDASSMVGASEQTQDQAQGNVEVIED